MAEATGYITYINGAQVQYTGVTRMLHGALAYETRIIGDSPRIGEARWTYHPPMEA